MHTLFITQLVSADIIKAICWTLVHSLWQGLLLAIAGGLVVLFTKKQHPSLRYNLLSGLFLLFVVSSAYTFTSQLENPDLNNKKQVFTAQENINQPSLSFNFDNPSTFKQTINGFSNEFTYYFDKHAPLIVIAWFILLSARLVKMFSGITYINKVRNRKVFMPSHYWINRLSELQLLLRIKKHIRLMESGIIKVPMAVGWLKPVILIPVGLFNHLPEDELEAILLHELAHIKRRDYFVNLLQSLAETLYSFNPAVLWISSLIREERENCCDDMAIAVTKSKTKFIHALVSFQEYNNTEFAMPFPGRKNQLLNRVQRIIYNTNKSLNNIEKAGIVSCCLAMIVLSAFIIPHHERHTLLSEILNTVTINTGAADHGPTSEDYSSGNNNESNKALEETPSTLKKSTTVDKKHLLKSSIVRPVNYSDYYNSGLKTDTSPLKKTQVYISNIQINTNSNLIFKDSLKLNTLVKLDNIRALNELKIKLSTIEVNLLTNYTYTYDSSFIKQPYKRDSSYKLKLRNKQLRPSLKTNSNPVPRAESATLADPQPRHNPLADPVIIDLIKEKIIQEAVIINKEDFYYVLNNRALIVQGMKQAESLYQKLRTKYIHPTGNTTRSYIWRN